MSNLPIMGCCCGTGTGAFDVVLIAANDKEGISPQNIAVTGGSPFTPQFPVPDSWDVIQQLVADFQPELDRQENRLLLGFDLVVGNYFLWARESSGSSLILYKIGYGTVSSFTTNSQSYSDLVSSGTYPSYAQVISGGIEHGGFLWGTNLSSFATNLVTDSLKVGVVRRGSNGFIISEPSPGPQNRDRIRNVGDALAPYREVNKNTDGNLFTYSTGITIPAPILAEVVDGDLPDTATFIYNRAGNPGQVTIYPWTDGSFQYWLPLTRSLVLGVTVSGQVSSSGIVEEETTEVPLGNSTKTYKSGKLRVSSTGHSKIELGTPSSGVSGSYSRVHTVYENTIENEVEVPISETLLITVTPTGPSTSVINSAIVPYPDLEPAGYISPSFEANISIEASSSRDGSRWFYRLSQPSGISYNLSGNDVDLKLDEGPSQLELNVFLPVRAALEAEYPEFPIVSPENWPPPLSVWPNIPECQNNVIDSITDLSEQVWYTLRAIGTDGTVPPMLCEEGPSHAMVFYPEYSYTLMNEEFTYFVKEQIRMRIDLITSSGFLVARTYTRAENVGSSLLFQGGSHGEFSYIRCRLWNETNPNKIYYAIHSDGDRLFKPDGIWPTGSFGFLPLPVIDWRRISKEQATFGLNQ